MAAAAQRFSVARREIAGVAGARAVWLGSVSPPDNFRSEDGCEPALNPFCAQSALPEVPAATSRKSDQSAKSLLRRINLINRTARQRLRTTHPVWNAPTNGISMMVAFRAVSAQRSRMTLVALKRKTIKTPPGRALEVSAR
jgi:hypothetical protein